MLRRINILNALITFEKIERNIIPKPIWFRLLLYELIGEGSLCLVTSWSAFLPRNPVILENGKLRIQISGAQQVDIWVPDSEDLNSYSSADNEDLHFGENENFEDSNSDEDIEVIDSDENDKMDQMIE